MKNSAFDESQVLVILPAFNEEVTIGGTIQKIRQHLPQVRIVVVDNASNDSTREIAIKSKVEVLVEPRRGKGFAVQRGFDFAIAMKAEAIVLVDADETYGVSNLKNAIQLIFSQGYDLITGTRVPVQVLDSQQDRARRHFRFGHQIGNKFFVTLSNLLFPTGVKDVLSGWRVMSRRFVASFPGDAEGFEIESRLNSHAYTVKAAVTNIEVNYYPRRDGSDSKLNTYTDGLRIFRANLKNFRNDRPFYAFSFLATPWAIATIYFAYLPFTSYFDTGLVPYLPRLISAVGTFVIASLLWMSGILLERIRQIRLAITLKIFQSNSFQAT